MCTLSFIPSEHGYVVAMNRDEQFSRPRSSPPSVFQNAIYPHEIGGGTWLAINACGLTLALLNRNEDGLLPVKLRSRGELIPALIHSDSLAEVHRRLLELGCRGIWPFRLLAFSAAEHEICDWTWGTQFAKENHDWHAQHWYSSGLSDREATRIRSAIVQKAWQQPDSGALEWIRALHKSHLPQPGPYSICMHRDDAVTVSYNEIICGQGLVTFRYAAGSPCEATRFDAELSLPIPTSAYLSC